MPVYSLVGFSIEALLITNIFVFFYTSALRLLNSTFPVENPTEFIRVGALPEPFEISLYLGLSFTCVMAIFVLNKLSSNNQETRNKKYSILKYLSLIFLILLFISNLGAYPMARSVYPYQQSETVSTYRFFLISYLSVVTALIFLSIKFKNYTFFSILIFIAIAIATFEPRFPIVGHDYSYFFGPIWEIVNGKTLYTQVPSQYGFLSILFFSLLYKFHIFNIAYLPAVVWLFYIIQYFLGFFLIYKISRSLQLAVIGLFSILSINYFSIYHLPATIPQTGPLRWLPVVLSLFFLHKFKSLTSKTFIFILSFLSLWVLDSGISLILAYGFTLFLLFLSRKIDLRNLFRSLVYLCASLLIIFFAINVLHLMLGYKMINLISVFAKLQQYAKAGFGMIPLDLQTYFWVVLLFYFASIIYYFRKQTIDDRRLKVDVEARGSRVEKNNLSSSFYPPHPSSILHLPSSVLLFSANLSLLASVYFVGRSHPHNLFHISIFPILNAFLLFGLILKNNFNKNRSFFFIFYFLFFILFIVYPIYQRQEVMTKMLKNKIARFKAGNIFTPEWINILGKKYEAEVALIKDRLPEQEILILSPDDTYLFYLTGKKNLMNDNSQITILTKKDMDASLEKVYKHCPSKIVADCTLFKKCEASKPFSVAAFFSIQPILLNRIQEACRISYQPTVCTNQLCIAESKR